MGNKRIYRVIFLVLIDLSTAFTSLYLGLILRFNSFNIDGYQLSILQMGIIFALIITITYYLFGLYRSLWKYASIEELVKLIFASFISIVVLFSINLIGSLGMPNSVFAIAMLIQVGLSGSIRFSYRVLRILKLALLTRGYKNQNINRILVIGSGDEAAATIKYFNSSENSDTIVAIVDRINSKGTVIHNVRIQGKLAELEQVIRKFSVTEIIIASEIFTEEDMSFTLDICARIKCKLKKYAAVSDVGSQNLIVDINPEDLLGRAQVELNQEELERFLIDKTVFVTGGGGSIGSELVRQIAKFSPKKIIIIDILENYAYLIMRELSRKYKDIEITVEIASIRDEIRIEFLFNKYKPEIVFHAAAHKHVPLMEIAPCEAIKNNILGTINIAENAHKYNVEKMTLISTDKAVNPTNVMGVTKRIAEMVIQSYNKISDTEFCAVRFGNVLGSSGSVIPIFMKQIEEGGPITVTHKDITRYFMTIPEACQLVMQAGALAKGGEIFILNMGEQIKITDLAENLIKLHGLEPGTDIKIEYIGLRKGEKLYEELILTDEDIRTKHEKIYVARCVFMEIDDIKKKIKEIQQVIPDIIEIKKKLKELVPEYKITEQ